MSVRADYDAVVVGSGINSLVAAALLAKGGWRVCVLERNDWFGGAIRTAEITEPGFVHEVFASGTRFSPARRPTRNSGTSCTPKGSST